MVRNIRPATLVSLGVLLLLIVPATAQGVPPSCPNASLTTTPGQRIALAGNPCTDPEGDSYTVAIVTPPSGALSTESGTNY